jgi:hypothetical protein
MSDEMKLRNLDAHGQAICSVCKEVTASVYSRRPMLNCWSCAAVFEPMTEREGQATVATMRYCLRELNHLGEAFVTHIHNQLLRLERSTV